MFVSPENEARTTKIGLWPIVTWSHAESRGVAWDHTGSPGIMVSGGVRWRWVSGGVVSGDVGGCGGSGGSRMVPGGYVGHVRPHEKRLTFVHYFNQIDQLTRANPAITLSWRSSKFTFGGEIYTGYLW